MISINAGWDVAEKCEPAGQAERAPGGNGCLFECKTWNGKVARDWRIDIIKGRRIISEKVEPQGRGSQGYARIQDQSWMWVRTDLTT